MSRIVIKFGGYQNPASTHNRAASRFGEVLLERMGDRVSFELIGNVLNLGRQSGDLPKMVAAGELSFCYISSVRFTAAVPEFKVLELPYIIKDRASAQRAFSGEFGALLRRRMAENTPHLLMGIWEGGFRHVTNRVRPIRTPADCKGLKIRCQLSDIHAEALRAIGFEPVPVDVKEFVDGITGPRFDGQENPLTNTYNFGVQDFHRYHTLTSHLFGASVMICNAAAYRSWPDDLRAAVDAAAAEATRTQLALAAAEDDEMLAKLRRVEGHEIIELDAAGRAPFVAAVQPVLEKYRRELDPALFDYLA
jgi:TRAP-type C4-dicarboxylate transport system substrate-binding protein